MSGETLNYYFKQFCRDIRCQIKGHDIPCGTFMLCQKCYRSFQD